MIFGRQAGMTTDRKPRWWIEHAPDTGIEGLGETWTIVVEWVVDGQKFAATQTIPARLANDGVACARLAASLAAKYEPPS
jgi:hypothetical protein